MTVDINFYGLCQQLLTVEIMASGFHMICLQYMQVIKLTVFPSDTDPVFVISALTLCL